MTRTVFVYEFITGGGLYSFGDEARPEGSLLAEGAAMVAAFASDVARIPNTKVVTLCDQRLNNSRLAQGLSIYATLNRIGDSKLVSSTSQHDEALAARASEADTCFIIAPELDNQLERITQTACDAGGRIVSPSSHGIRWASDKNKTQRELVRIGVPTIQAIELAPASGPTSHHADQTNALPYPVVAKPIYGAGSNSVLRCNTTAELRAYLNRHDKMATRIEPFLSGEAISVSAIPGSGIVFPPCRQLLSADSHFTYQGGVVSPSDLSKSVVAEAQSYARLIAKHLGGCGFTGIDMIASDQGVFVVEVNPRLTTSYIGLRAATSANLAESVLGWADSNDMEFRKDVPFRADDWSEESL